MGPQTHQKEQKHIIMESKVVLRGPFWLSSQDRAAEIQVGIRVSTEKASDCQRGY